MKNYMKLAPSLPLRLDASSYTVAAGDVDGDGRLELVVLNPVLPTLGVLSYFSYSDLLPQWANPGPGTIIDTWLCTLSVPGGWDLYANDQYFVADLDGDGVDEVVVYQSSSGYLGVLEWDGEQLQTVWGQPLIPSLGLPSPACQFFVADVDGNGSDELVLFDPTSLSLGVLKWADGAVTKTWLVHTLVPGGLYLRSWDQLLVANLDGGTGDKSQEIVVFSAGDQYLVALKWDPVNQELACWGEAAHTAIGGGSSRLWTMSSGDQYRAADLDGNGSDELLVFNTGAQTCGLLGWDESQFTVIVSTPHAGPFGESLQHCYPADLDGDRIDELVVVGAPLGTAQLSVLKWDGSQLAAVYASQTFGGTAPAWINGQTVQLAADVDGDRRDELVVISASASEAQVLKSGAPTENDPWGMSLSSLWDTEHSVAGLNPTLIADAPANGFLDFSGTQAEIYAQVGPSLVPQTSSDLRSEYTNEDNKDNFAAWASQIEDADANQETWQWLSNYSGSDFAPVLSTLAAETGAISTIYTHYDNLYQSLLDIKIQQDGDLAHCTSLIAQTAPPPAASPLAYWMEGLFDACLWGVAAVPGLNAFAIPLAMLASIGGTVFGAQGGNGQPSRVDYATFQTQIDNNYINAKSALNGQAKAIVTDRFKLATLGTLLQGLWHLDVGDAEQFLSNGSAANRIYFYRLLLPLVFNIAYYMNSENDHPTYKYTAYFPIPDTTTETLQCPAYSFYVEQSTTESGRYNVYLLCGGTSPSSLSFPSESLVDDLFTNLNIARSDFFHGSWVLPEVDGFSFHEGL